VRKVVYSKSVSLDGFIEAVDGDLNWLFPDEDQHKHYNDRERMIVIHLYGRRLYENTAAYLPTADENPSAPPYGMDHARIASTFIQHGLIDENWLYVHPVVLGGGKPMFNQLRAASTFSWLKHAHSGLVLFSEGTSLRTNINDNQDASKWHEPC
jgi:dihydrofolate reductase